MKYKLNNKNYAEYVTDDILIDLLRDRGIDNPAEWLNPPSGAEYTPHRLGDMGKAVDILYNFIKHHHEGHICVVVDGDMDGWSSSAIMLRLLKDMVNEQEVSYIIHPGKEHGIIMKELSADIDLLIVPDAGSNQYEEHLQILDKGKQLIILDHHVIEEEKTYPPEYANRIALVNCLLNDYPNPHLSGSGVTLKFAQAYYEKLKKPFPMIMYAYAACGLVSDLMDLSVLENKSIVSTGLKYIKDNSFLQGLIEKAHFKDRNPEATVRDLGWVLGPQINAIIRLGDMAQKRTVFNALVSPDQLVVSGKRGANGEEVPAGAEAMRICTNAKKRQSTAMANSIETIIESNSVKQTDNCIIYIDESQELTFELSGLIANQLMAAYNRPVILLKRYQDNHCDQYRGSMRGKPVEGLESFKDFLTDLSGVSYVQGHAFAAGIGVEAESIEVFKAHLEEALSKYNFDTDLFFVDLVGKYNTITRPVQEAFARDDIWGHGVTKPLALLQDIPTAEVSYMGDNAQHIKIDCGSFDTIIFNNPDLANSLLSGNKYLLDVVGEFSIDTNYNVGRMQFICKQLDTKDYVAPTIRDWVF